MWRRWLQIEKGADSVVRSTMAVLKVLGPSDIGNGLICTDIITDQRMHDECIQNQMTEFHREMRCSHAGFRSARVCSES